LSWLEEHVLAPVDRKWFVECDIVNASVGVDNAAKSIITNEEIIINDLMESEDEIGVCLS